MDCLYCSIFFAAVCGIVEGIGLLIFQRINWAQWGRTMHVSAPILWISPVVDVILFVPIGCIAFLLSGLLRLPAVRLVCSVLTFFALYDGLRFTNRLYPTACLIFAVACAVVIWRGTAKHDFGLFRRLWWIPVVLMLGLACATEVWPRMREHYKIAQLPKPAPGAPNVLVIVIDTLRADVRAQMEHLSA